MIVLNLAREGLRKEERRSTSPQELIVLEDQSKAAPLELHGYV